MKHKTFSPAEKPAVAPPALTDERAEGGIASACCPEEVARRAYFSYVNEGAPEGRSVQHWLDAEAELIRERNLTRTHGFHNRT